MLDKIVSLTSYYIPYGSPRSSPIDKNKSKWTWEVGIINKKLTKQYLYFHVNDLSEIHPDLHGYEPNHYGNIRADFMYRQKNIRVIIHDWDVEKTVYYDNMKDVLERICGQKT